MAQHLLLPRLCLLRGNRRLLRSFLYLRILLAHVPLHRPGPTQPKRLLPRNSTKTMALAIELDAEMLCGASLADPAQWVDMV
jgi:hypothetical protein